MKRSPYDYTLVLDTDTYVSAHALSDRVCQVLVCRGRYGLRGVFLLFILGLSLGGVGPVRGLWGGGRRGWCEEGARSD
jgi:hypothetical protein